MTDHRGFWGAFSLFCLSIGVGGYVSYTIANAYTKRPVIHLGYIPTICLVLTILGVVVFLGLVYVYARLWRVKRYVTKAMIEGDVLYAHARIQMRLGTAAGTEDLDKRIHDWRVETLKWLERHDRNAYAKFINDAGLVIVQGQLENSVAGRCVAELDIRLSRLLDIAAEK